MERETPPEGTVGHRPGRGDPVTGDLHREHWIVPVHGLTRADPDGIVQAIARRDGTVILHLVCGGSRTTVRFGVSRAAQLSAGIWEAAGVAQQLTGYLGDDQPRHSSPMPRRRPARVNNGAVMDATRVIGWRIRRIRNDRDKSLRVIAGLAGMSKSTLHRIERGQREVTLSEIVALAGALEIAPATLIRLPILALANGHTDAGNGAAHCQPGRTKPAS